MEAATETRVPMKHIEAGNFKVDGNIGETRKFM